jgi:hypothetical protein
MFFLFNLHVTSRPIWLTRHGESEFNVQGRIGGDSGLSLRGSAYAARLEGAAPAYSPSLGDRKVMWVSPSAELAGPLVSEIAAVNLRSGLRTVMGAGRMFPILNLTKLPFKPRRLGSYTLRELQKLGALENGADIEDGDKDELFEEGVVFLTYAALSRVLPKGVKVPSVDPAVAKKGKAGKAPAAKRARGAGGGGAAAAAAEEEEEEEAVTDAAAASPPALRRAAAAGATATRKAVSRSL